MMEDERLWLTHKKPYAKKIKNLSEIFGSFADNCYFCNQIEGYL